MKKKKKKLIKKTNILIKVFRFFFPKDFHAELIKGMQAGEDIKRGKLSPKWLPTWWLGKGVRKVIDPKHKMKVGKEKKQ